MLYITDPVLQTWIFFSLLVLALLLSMRRRKDTSLFPLSTTQELKGLAIILIIVAHVGYGLVNDSRFLWPITNLAGLGVNIFLFVSGYGLTVSSIRKPLGIKEFYTKRLKKLFLPFWIVLAIYFLLDYFVLKRTYPAEYVARSFAGIFKTADMHADIDSPLWYFSFILFYYLLYPILYIKKRPWLTAIIFYGITYALLHHSQYIENLDNVRFYKVYNLAFPLGMVAAWLTSNQAAISKKLKSYISPAFKSKALRRGFYYGSIALLILLFIYGRKHSAPWDSPRREQAINILTMFCLIGVFLLKKVDFKFLYIFGIYSYEVYLLHWPLMSRYDFLFSHVYSWLAVALYMAVFIGLSILLARAAGFLDTKTRLN
jgi:peptidoglycan/LPS O-acetylase OafA/YrhL